MRAIGIVLGDQLIARIYEDGRFEQLIELQGKARPNLLQLYEDCFYNVPNSSTFDERFNHAERHNYFCWTKPALQLAALIIPQDRC